MTKTDKIDKKKELENKLARSLADYQNLLKRVEKEKEETILKATRRLVEDLLPVLDDFERAQNHLDDQGLKMAIDQFHQVLNENGVEEIPTQPGDKFDSSVHEVIEKVPGGQKGEVAQILTKGYKWINGTLIRPVKVQVYDQHFEKEEELEN